MYNVALCGAGVVGGGVVKLLKNLPSFRISKILVRDKAKKRDFLVPDTATLVTSTKEITDDASLDILVEVMGGVDDAYALIKSFLDRGKRVVTANKVLLAMHPELLENACLSFEAAVCGGVPIVRSLMNAYATDRIQVIEGIFNGTTNFILNQMAVGDSYEKALVKAQHKGLAEADPSADVDGHDCRQKLKILVRVALGAVVPTQDIPLCGIRKLNQHDFAYARMLGCTIRLMAHARLEKGKVSAYVLPTLVPMYSLEGSTFGSNNLVRVYSKSQCTTYSGQGAGRFPTANSVVSDLWNPRSTTWVDMAVRTDAELNTSSDGMFFLRFTVTNEVGIIAEVGSACSENKVGIDAVFQIPQREESMAFALTTETTTYAQVRQVVKKVLTNDWCHDVSVCKYLLNDQLITSPEASV